MAARGHDLDNLIYSVSARSAVGAMELLTPPSLLPLDPFHPPPHMFHLPDHFLLQ